MPYDPVSVSVLNVRSIQFQLSLSSCFTIYFSFVSVFSVGAFLKKRVDYSHGFSSVFSFDTPEVIKIVLTKVLQNFKAPNCTFWPRELDYNICSF